MAKIDLHKLALIVGFEVVSHFATTWHRAGHRTVRVCASVCVGMMRREADTVDRLRDCVSEGQSGKHKS